MFSKYDIIKKPIITEKSSLMNKSGVFVFKVSASASKAQIKIAIESVFEVKVLSVNTINVHSYQKRFRGKSGVVSGFKKAIVKIDGGKEIDFSKIK